MSTIHEELLFFFLNATPTTAIYTLSLHDALPISLIGGPGSDTLDGGAGINTADYSAAPAGVTDFSGLVFDGTGGVDHLYRSEEHTSELQSHVNLVCRLLLEKKKNTMYADDVSV